MQTKKYNGNIEVIRYFLALAVVTVHFQDYIYGTEVFVPGAHLTVDFFFVISGFFMARSLKKNPDPFIYTFNKWGGMFWIYEGALLLAVIINGNLSLSETVTWLLRCIPEYFGLQLIGFFRMLHPLFWYISAMLIGSFVIAVLHYVLDEKHFKAVLAFIILAGYALVYHLNGDMDAAVADGKFFIPLPVVRGTASISLGIITGWTAERLKDSKLWAEKKYRVLNSVLDGIIIILFIYFALPKAYTYYDYYCLLLIPVIMIYAANGNTLWSEVSNRIGNGLTGIFGKQFTLAFYCFSGSICVLLGRIVSLGSMNPWKAFGFFLLIHTAVSFLLSKLNDVLTARFPIRIQNRTAINQP